VGRERKHPDDRGKKGMTEYRQIERVLSSKQRAKNAKTYEAQAKRPETDKEPAQTAGERGRILKRGKGGEKKGSDPNPMGDQKSHEGDRTRRTAGNLGEIKRPHAAST